MIKENLEKFKKTFIKILIIIDEKDSDRKYGKLFFIISLMLLSFFIINELFSIKVIFSTFSSQIFAIYIGFLPSSAESSRYLLSALAQSQAAIIAIVITITLISLQFAQSHTIWIIKIFERQRIFWIVLFIYAFSIIYDMILLQIISEDISNIKNHIALSTILFTVAIFIIFPFISSTLKLLNPIKIIDELSANINSKEIKKYGIDSLLSPLINMANTAILRQETDVSLICINSIVNKCKLFGIKRFGECDYYINALEQISAKSLDQRDDESTQRVIKGIGEIGESVTKLHSPADIGISLKHLGIRAIETDLSKSYYQSIDSLNVLLSALLQANISQEKSDRYQYLETDLRTLEFCYYSIGEKLISYKWSSIKISESFLVIGAFSIMKGYNLQNEAAKDLANLTKQEHSISSKNKHFGIKWAIYNDDPLMFIRENFQMIENKYVDEFIKFYERELNKLTP